ncbi:MAG: type IV pilus biogenesis/stability protein PilW [Panacagrimonas sp.]
MLVLMSACTTTQDNAPGVLRRPQPDFKEAARINTELGTAYTRNGDLDLALDKFDRALDQDPELAAAHAGIAFVYVRRGEPQRAEEHYLRALQLDARDAATRNNFAVFLCGQNRGREADRQFQEAANDPRYGEPEKAWTNAGVCARRVPDLDRAEGYFRKALAIRPEFAEALAQMASLSAERGDYLHARAFLQRYEKVAPPSVQMLALGAQIEHALGDTGAAAEYERRLKAQSPSGSEENPRPSTRPAP